jgi:hypothetical protein
LGALGSLVAQRSMYVTSMPVMQLYLETLDQGLLTAR